MLTMKFHCRTPDTGRHTDFRRKVTPEIGVTIQNLSIWHTNLKHESKKASAEQKALDNYYDAAKDLCHSQGAYMVALRS